MNVSVCTAVKGVHNTAVFYFISFDKKCNSAPVADGVEYKEQITSDEDIQTLRTSQTF